MIDFFGWWRASWTLAESPSVLLDVQLWKCGCRKASAKSISSSRVIGIPQGSPVTAHYVTQSHKCHLGHSVLYMCVGGGVLLAFIVCIFRFYKSLPYQLLPWQQLTGDTNKYGEHRAYLLDLLWETIIGVGRLSTWDILGCCQKTNTH